MKREELIDKFNQKYSNLAIEVDKEEYSENDKVKIICKRCKHYWPSSIKNVIIFKAGCYKCKGQGYSMDEIKILNFIKENYISKDERRFFIDAESGCQYRIHPNEPKFEPIGKFKVPLYYMCDGFTRITYEYDQENKILKRSDKRSKGTIFEILGDYHHSNPLYYRPDDISPRSGMTHKENYEYTMNRLKHIEEHGYKVFYIWITDFRRFTRALEKDNTANIFDYMNIEKKYNDIKPDYTLLSKTTQLILTGRDFCEF